MEHLFKLRSGSAPRYSLRGGPTFSQPDNTWNNPQFQFVAEDATVDGREDEIKVVDHLQKRDCLEHIHPSRLEDVLDGSADDVAESIRSGAVDDLLDAVLFAEREHEDRDVVVAAIAERSDELASQEAQDEQTDSLTPDDLAV